MKKILFPTDFSETADGAFTYALFMADQLDATIYCLHVYSLAHTADMLAPAEIITSLQDEEEEWALEKMEAYHRRIEAETEKEISIKPLLKPGFAADGIAEACRSLEPDLLVMGTQGATNAIDKMLGSVTSQVIQESQVPVLAIPNGTHYTPINRIAYATDFQAKEEKAVGQLGEMARSLGASVAAVHVLKSDMELPAPDEEAQVENYYRAAMGMDSLQLFHLRHDDTAKGLAQFMEREHADVLATSTYHRGFFERLFHRSLTRQLALYAGKPLLVFHS